MSWISDSARLGSPALAGSWDVSAPFHEHRLARQALSADQGMPPDIFIAGMVAILLLVYLRLDAEEVRSDPAWEISRMGSDGRLSVHAFVTSLRASLDSGSYTVGDFARWIYADYVILQHQLVAISKLPDNTFRFQRESDRLRFYHHYNPLSFQDSRFRALSTTVHELGLCGDLGLPEHPLTAMGREILRTGDNDG